MHSYQKCEKHSFLVPFPSLKMILIRKSLLTQNNFMLKVFTFLIVLMITPFLKLHKWYVNTFSYLKIQMI